MYRKQSYTSVNKPRCDSFSQIYQGTSDLVLSTFEGINLSILPPCRDLVFLFAEHHWKCRLKKPIIRHSYQFPNEPSPEEHDWKFDDDGSWTGGKIVQQELIDVLFD